MREERFELTPFVAGMTHGIHHQPAGDGPQRGVLDLQRRGNAVGILRVELMSSVAELDAVVELKLARVQERFETTHHAALSWDRQLVQAIRARATESESGARAVYAILTHGLLPGLAGQVLDRIAGGAAIGDVHVGVDPRGDPSFEFRP